MNLKCLGVYIGLLGKQANFDVCKECLERLGLETPIEVSNPFRPTSKITQTEPSDDIDQELYSVNATDLFPCRQTFLHQPDILYFQGVKYPPEDIARHWKKDSRTWLWKSVRRRRNKSVSTNETCETNTENIENE
ncbi:uncharacterized protein LOC116429594 [Nomia melanderi]|uniref:uncharacterized protein LOC116429594 n=1 Tax=Nomia melanderi TaxID=2448451 RepID=UPI003FCDEF04